MAADVQIGPPEQQLGNRRFVTKDHWGPSSYDATNGDILDSRMFNCSVADAVFIGGQGVVDATGVLTHEVRVSFTGGTLPSKLPVLRWYVIATGAQVANGVDLSGSRVRVTVMGA